jgi:hypothetical protein
VSEDSGFLVSHGHELRWSRDDLPIAVLLEKSASAYEPEFVAVANAYNQAIGRTVFLRPTTTVLSALVDAFELERSRASIRSTILVRGDGPIDIRHLGSTDLRFDERVGRILNAIVLMPDRDTAIQALGLGDWSHGQQLLYQAGLHEFGHVLGLDHDTAPNSIMWTQVRTESTVLLSGDVDRLRKAYA